jgi:putative transposase
MSTAVAEIEELGGSRRYAYRVLGVSRATQERHRRPRLACQERRRPSAIRALTAPERQAVVETLNSPRFVDQPPAEIYHCLLDEGIFLCSTRTMYRILRQENGLRERRAVRTHPAALVPSASASSPNQVWVWDITKLKGPIKWVYYSLYLILDLFSRFIVGWLLAPRESSGHAAHLIRETCHREGIHPQILTLHSDRGAPMTSKTVAQLLVDLAVDPSFSRPRVSDDNAFAEASFKTLKYQPEFPDCFASIGDARVFIARFVAWYNEVHYHSGLGGLTPACVHHGTAPGILARRQELLNCAYQAHPERFVKGPPVVAGLPERVYLVPPRQGEASAPATSAESTPPPDSRSPATARALVRRTSSQLHAAEPSIPPAAQRGPGSTAPAPPSRPHGCPSAELSTC